MFSEWATSLGASYHKARESFIKYKNAFRVLFIQKMEKKYSVAFATFMDDASFASEQKSTMQ